MLSRQEKLAWYNIGVFALAFVVFALLAWIFGQWLPAMGAFGVCGLWGLGPKLLFPRGKAKDYLDERDLSIQRTSMMIAYSVFWGVFVIGIMSLWLLHRKAGCVPVEYLPLMVFGGMMIVIVTSSISTLVLYRRGIADVEG